MNAEVKSLVLYCPQYHINFLRESLDIITTSGALNLTIT